MVQPLDFIGIGFGPANIALAIQLQENHLDNKLKHLFIDSNKDSLWQHEMLIDGTDIQNVPVRDLITPINPQSHYTFINYLHKTGKYFKYYGTGLTYPLRKDYAMYINWCASHFKHNVNYQETVNCVDISESGDHYIVRTNHSTYHTRIIVLATGRSLYIPELFNRIPEQRMITINNFISKISALKRSKKYRFAVVGASQSAAEIFLELSEKFYNSIVHSYIRKFSFVMRDSSPFSFEVFFPEFIDEYYEADDHAKISLNNHLRRTNYSSVDIEVLDKINIKMYEENLTNNHRMKIIKNSEITNLSYDNETIYIKSRNTVNNQEQSNAYDFIIICTGFKDLGNGDHKEYLPPLLQQLANKLVKKNNKRMTEYITKNYEIFFKDVKHPIYLNGLCETSHGMGDAGSFGLISIRVNRILNSIASHLIALEKIT